MLDAHIASRHYNNAPRTNKSFGLTQPYVPVPIALCPLGFGFVHSTSSQNHLSVFVSACVCVFWCAKRLNAMRETTFIKLRHTAYEHQSVGGRCMQFEISMPKSATAAAAAATAEGDEENVFVNYAKCSARSQPLFLGQCLHQTFRSSTADNGNTRFRVEMPNAEKQFFFVFFTFEFTWWIDSRHASSSVSSSSPCSAIGSRSM